MYACFIDIRKVLLHIYMDQLSKLPETLQPHGLDLEGKEVKCLFYADDLLTAITNKRPFEQTP